MALTTMERRILEFANQDMSDYQIGRELNIIPPTICRMHKRAQRKLKNASEDLEWAKKAGIDPTEFGVV